jgi:hypothetical protein
VDVDGVPSASFGHKSELTAITNVEQAKEWVKGFQVA